MTESCCKYFDALGVELLPWQRRYLAELEAHEAAENIRIVYGDPSGPRPTGILTVATSAHEPFKGIAAILDEVHECKRGMVPALRPESWRRNGKKRGIANR